jgi:hypothetical protein
VTNEVETESSLARKGRDDDGNAPPEVAARRADCPKLARPGAEDAREQGRTATDDGCGKARLVPNSPVNRSA